MPHNNFLMSENSRYKQQLYQTVFYKFNKEYAIYVTKCDTEKQGRKKAKSYINDKYNYYNDKYNINNTYIFILLRFFSL